MTANTLEPTTKLNEMLAELLADRWLRERELRDNPSACGGKLVDLNEYQDVAAATMNPELSVPDKAANCALGLSDEHFELLAIFYQSGGEEREWPFTEEQCQHVVEELGDTMWYAAVLCKQLDIPLGALFGSDPIAERVTIPATISAKKLELRQSYYNMSCAIGDIVCAMKKCRYQGHSPDVAVIRRIALSTTAIVVCVRLLAVAVGSTLKDVCDLNIAKLSERYPSGTFRAKDSIDRKEATGRKS